MKHFVAFLRGVNVGGHIVVKETLREAFASLGFQNVSTFKQSGNVVFETDLTDPQDVELKIQERLRSKLGYEVSVFVRTIPQLKSVIDLDPFGGQDKGSAFLVTFFAVAPANSSLHLPLTIPKSKAQIISIRGKEAYSVTHGGGEGGMPNPFLESKLKAKATTRNMNTIRQIVEKYGQVPLLTWSQIQVMSDLGLDSKTHPDN